jgi:molecular chaperone GrpE
MFRTTNSETPRDQPETAAGAAAEPAGEQEVAGLKAQLDETYAKYQRAVADHENYKRRSRQDLVERTQYANEQLVLKLLPLLDNFQRALEHAPEGIDPQWFEGVKLIAKQFEDILQGQGVSSISAVGEKFDPTQHEAIASEQTDEHEEGTVVEEVQRGYKLHRKVLRPTLVKIAQPRSLQ